MKPDLALFDSPWRIHWDARGRGLARLAPSIRGSRPLELLVEVDGPEDLLELGLPWEETSVSAVIWNWQAAAGLTLPEGVERFEFPVSGPEEARRLLTGAGSRLPGGRTAFRWQPARGQLAWLAAMLDLAEVSGWGLTLPNRPAGAIRARGAEAFPDAGEVRREASGLASAAARLVGRLRVHDYPISMALGIGGPEPQGCEAANALAFVDPEGHVYPCDTLRVRMGTLGETGMAEIWAGPLRLRLRRDLSCVPAPCAGCGLWERCRGGCRGAVYTLHGHYGSPDPMCPEQDEAGTSGGTVSSDCQGRDGLK